MKLDNIKTYTIFNRETQEWGIPFFVKTDIQARRWFQKIANDTRNIITEPTDLELYKIGSYNDITGEILPTTKELIERGKKINESTKSIK